MPIISGIVGGQGARNAGRTIGAAGTAASTAIGTAGNQAAAGTTAAGAAGQAGVSSAVGAGQQAVGAAGTQATNDVYGATGQANQALGNIYGGQLGMESPYLQTGQAGTNALANQVANPFQAPTAAQAEATPGYQFQLTQGLQGVQQQLGATGGGATGGDLKALTQYGQGLASTYYQNAFNNSLNAYNTNTNTAATAAGQGLTAAGQTNQAAENFGNQFSANTIGAGTYAGNTGLGTAMYGSNLGMQGAQYNAGLGLQAATTAGNQNMTGTEEAGNFFMQGAQGTAAGQMGQANGYASAINGASNLLMGGLTGGLGGGGLIGSLGNLFNTGPINTYNPNSGSAPSGYQGAPVAPSNGISSIFGGGANPYSSPGAVMVGQNQSNAQQLNQSLGYYGGAGQ